MVGLYWQRLDDIMARAFWVISAHDLRRQWKVSRGTSWPVKWKSWQDEKIWWHKYNFPLLLDRVAMVWLFSKSNYTCGSCAFALCFDGESACNDDTAISQLACQSKKLPEIPSRLFKDKRYGLLLRMVASKALKRNNTYFEMAQSSVLLLFGFSSTIVNRTSVNFHCKIPQK